MSRWWDKGQGEVGGYTRRVKTPWLCLGSAVKSLQLEPGGPFSCLGIIISTKQYSVLSPRRASSVEVQLEELVSIA